MFVFRRCKLPSAQLAAGLLLWSLVAGTAWVGLAARFDADQAIKHAGLLAFFTLFSAAVPAIIHYAILRRGNTLRIEWVTLAIIGAISITALAGKSLQLQRQNQIVRSLYYEWDKEFLTQWEAPRKERRHAEMVSLLEQKCDAYREELAARGEAWSYGFAADAANRDPYPQRALAMLDRYEHELIHGPHAPDTPLHYLDDQIATTAGKLGDVMRDTSPRQRALIHRMLDRQLATGDGEPHASTTSLFTLMGRPDDAKRYLARIQRNHDQYFRAHMVEMLLERTLSPDIFNPEVVREMDQVLDAHLRTGETPGITTEQMHRIFKVLGRNAELEGANR